MAAERFYGGHEYFLGWRCITCGEIVDELILENRSRPRESVRASTEDRPETEEWSDL